MSQTMITRFYLYSVFKNLRFADPFLILYFMDRQLSLSMIGVLLGWQHLVTVILEIPSGVLADLWGRRRATALCFVCYALSFTGLGVTGLIVSVSTPLWIGICLTIFAVGEALRTGSHKAIMLDYLDSSDQSSMATELIGRTRAISKMSSAIAAVSGGILLAWSRDYATLFYLSASAAWLGFLLMLSYPRRTEGDAYRARRLEGTPRHRVESTPPKRAWRKPGFLILFFQSVVFESQVKIALKYFTQPFMKLGLGSLGLPIVAPVGISGLMSSGAFWVGIHEFVRDSLGSWGARMSSRFEQWMGSPPKALGRIYLSGVLAVLGLAGCALNLKWGLFPGLIFLVVLTLLQNLRRPIFVNQLNVQMEKQQRASILSIESFSRALTVAVLLPLFGYAADHFGLVAVWGLSSAILLMGLFLRIPRIQENVA